MFSKKPVISIYELFAKQSASVVEMSRELHSMFSEFDRLGERQAHMKDLEHACDNITRELVIQAHTVLILPMDTSEILELAGGLDDVADLIDATALRLTLYCLNAPAPDTQQITALLAQCTERLNGAVRGLADDRKRAMMRDIAGEIMALEKQADTLYGKAVGGLLNEPGAEPILVMKWQEVYERLEAAINKCEHVANLLTAIVLKHGH